MRLLTVTAPHVRAAIVACRNHLGHKPKTELHNPGDDPGVHRLSWPNGDAAEVTIVRHKPTVVQEL